MFHVYHCIIVNGRLRYSGVCETCCTSRQRKWHQKTIGPLSDKSQKSDSVEWLPLCRGVQGIFRKLLNKELLSEVVLASILSLTSYSCDQLKKQP